MLSILIKGTFNFLLKIIALTLKATKLCQEIKLHFNRKELYEARKAKK